MENNEKTLLVKCDCGCGMIEFMEDSDDFIYVTYYVSAFSANQENVWYNFKENVKLIWSIIRGKKFMLYDVVIRDKKGFKKAIREFVEE